jgi:hypothetical protein
MIASPPIEIAQPGGRERGGDLGGHPAASRHHADRTGRVRLRGVLGRPADPAHLADLGHDQAEAVGADDPRAMAVGELDHLGHVAPRDPLGDDHDQLDPADDRLEHRVLSERGGDGDDRAVRHIAE